MRLNDMGLEDMGLTPFDETTLSPEDRQAHKDRLISEGFTSETADRILADPYLIPLRMKDEVEETMLETANTVLGVYDFVHHEIIDHRHSGARYADTLCGERVRWNHTDRHGKQVTCSVCLNEAH